MKKIKNTEKANMLEDLKITSLAFFAVVVSISIAFLIVS